MLSGTRAFRRDTPVQSMNAILSEEPLPVTATNPNIPTALDRIVHRCLEKQPENRFQTAQDLAFALETVSGLASSSIGATASPRDGRPRLRKVLTLGIVPAVVVLAF